MQSTRLLIAAQRCSSASRINYLLKRCLSNANPTIRINRNNSFLSLVDNTSASSASHNRLLSSSKSKLNAIGAHQSIRYASSGSLPTHKKITLPALSPTMETGTLRSWAKQEGEKIVEGDILAEIETDKATLGFESIDEGYLAKILIPGGSKDVPVGKLCAIIVEKEEDIAAFKDFKGDSADSAGAGAAASKQSSGESPASSEKPEKKEKPSPTKEESTSSSSKKDQSQAKPTTTTTSSSDSDRVAISPLAKKLAQEKGVDFASIPGSGPNGRIVVEDVEKFLQGGGAKAKPQAKAAKETPAAPSKAAKKEAAPAGGYNEQQISDLRAEYARRVTESKTTIPHYYLNIQVELDEIVKLRQKLNAMLAPKSKDPKAKLAGITINDFLIKAAALACKRRPETNSVWMDKSIRQYDTVDINVAVATEAGAFIAPIVYNADQKGLSAISQEVSQLSAKANSGKLSGDELELGTFTISNLGMYGVTNFSAIIYPQQSAVLAIGGVETKLVPAAESPKGFRQSTVLNVTLACDHRVIDGAVGAQWLQEFKQFLESPGSMLL